MPYPKLIKSFLLSFDDVSGFFLVKSILNKTRDTEDLLTDTCATLSIHIQLPAFVAGTLDRVLVLFAHLTAL